MPSAVCIAAAFLAVSVACFAPEAAAETPASMGPTLTEALDVPLVQLEVSVKDGEGAPVLSLGHGDFQLFLAGLPVAVELFEPPRGSRPESLSLLIYIDPAFVQGPELATVREALVRWLRGGLGEGVRVTLVTAEPSLRLRLESTEDLEAAAAEIGGFQPRDANSHIADEYKQIQRRIDRIRADGRDLGKTSPEHAVHSLLARIDALGGEAQREIESTLTRLNHVSASMAGLPGRSVLMYVGGRLPLEAEQNLRKAWSAAFGPGSRWRLEAPEEEQESFESPSGSAGFEGRNSFLEAAAETANHHGVTLFFIDASRLGAAGHPLEAVGGSFGRQAPRGGSVPANVHRAGLEASTFLEALAKATGGQILTERRSLDEGLQRWAADFRSHYTLGFSWPPGLGEGLSDLEVRLEGGDRKESRKAWALHHRRRVRMRSADQIAMEETLSTLLLGSADNPLGVSVSLEEPPAPGKASRLSVQLPLSNVALVPDGRFHIGRISIFACSGDLSRALPSVSKAVVPVRIPNRELLTSLGRQVEYRLEVPGGASGSQIAVTVRDDFVPVLSTTRLTGEKAARSPRRPPGPGYPGTP